MDPWAQNHATRLTLGAPDEANASLGVLYDRELDLQCSIGGSQTLVRKEVNEGQKARAWGCQPAHMGAAQLANLIVYQCVCVCVYMCACTWSGG